VRIGEEVIGLVGVNIDVTEHKRAERRVHHLAHHDELTGLANRRGLQQRLDEAVARSRRRSDLLALILVDLDHFKDVNDRVGHDGGDEVLREVAGRLRRAGRASDTIARLGGDEFAILADGLRGPLDADRIVARLVEAARAPVRCAGQAVHPTVSAGVALFPSDADHAADLLRHADLALYRAKELGPGRWRFYDDRLRVQAQRRRTLESELRGALDRSELTVFYQPIIGLAGEAEISFEALLRWRHPERGLLTPAEFLAVAEETGLVVPIGELVLRRAAEDARRFAEAGGRLGRMAVNVARLQLLNGDLDGLVAAALHDTGLPPENLEIEVTESVFLGRNAGDAGDALRRLRAQGVGIVLDDFGTGYASLTHLRRLPLDKLKIDRSFVGDLGRRSDTALIVRTIIELGRRLGLRVVAEGVETAAQLAFLRAHGCHAAQGYLIAPPAPAVELLADPIALVRLAHLRTRQRRRAGQRPATLL
jgi:diguanylate cyclase (GGDEF)-like protein